MIKKGFTLVEVLIVIGIIGILSTVLMASFSGGTESARAAKCLNNMRNLSQGVISRAMKTNYFPPAGSYAAMGIDQNGVIRYWERVGWISWLSQNDPYHSHDGKARPTSYQKVPNAAACCEDDDDVTFALTNGVVWAGVRKDRGVYVCPLHLRHAQSNGKPTPHWSYAMNCWFGYTYSDDAETTDGDYGKYFTSGGNKLDRRLLFAELPFAIEGSTDSSNEVSEDNAYGTANDNPLNDSILQYKATVGGKSYNTRWSGTPEAIAFNHKSGKRFCAHVAFGDGHTEKLMKPRTEGGLNAVQLTALLCAGDSYSFDGSKYAVLYGTDDSGSDTSDGGSYDDN